VDDAGKPVLVKPRVPRDQLLTLIAQLPPCLIGMEACSGAHHWPACSSSTATPSS
jgi:transposase